MIPCLITALTRSVIRKTTRKKTNGKISKNKILNWMKPLNDENKLQVYEKKKLNSIKNL